jgi:hypothetical protein
MIPDPGYTPADIARYKGQAVRLLGPVKEWERYSDCSFLEWKGWYWAFHTRLHGEIRLDQCPFPYRITERPERFDSSAAYLAWLGANDWYLSDNTRNYINRGTRYWLEGIYARCAVPHQVACPYPGGYWFMYRRDARSEHPDRAQPFSLGVSDMDDTCFALHTDDEALWLGIWEQLKHIPDLNSQDIWELGLR